MNITKICLSCLIFFAQSCLAKNETKYYEPKIERLNGTLILLTFPGKPNYTSIKDGDAAETCPYLILDKPIDVVMKPVIAANSKIGYEPENNIRLVQLIVMNKPDRKIMKNGIKISVNGALFGASTGHHHAKVLFEAHKCTLTKMNKSSSHVKLNKNIVHSLFPGEFEQILYAWN